MAANRCFYALQKQLRSKLLRRNTKILLYKTLIKPVLTYASETWVMTKQTEGSIATFERRILRTIYGPVRDHNGWRRRYNRELYDIYAEPDVISSIKVGRLRWAGHVIRMDDDNPIKRLTLSTPQGRRRPGRPRTRWMDSVNADAAVLGVSNWKIKARDRQEWRRLLDSAKAHPGLSSL